jgi:hypothetical protein
LTHALFGPSSNITLDRAAGSHSLAASERSAVVIKQLVTAD